MLALSALAVFGGVTGLNLLLDLIFTEYIAEAKIVDIFDCTLNKDTEVEFDRATRERAEKICEEGKAHALETAMLNLKFDSLYASTAAGAQYLQDKADAMEEVFGN
jgi:hypothetical protein